MLRVPFAFAISDTALSAGVGTYSEGFAGAVTIGWTVICFSLGHGVPVRLWFRFRVCNLESRIGKWYLVTSEYVFPTVLLRSIIAAKEDVMTTLLTVGALFLIALRIPVVPIMAKIHQT